jgi:hypothetical protein
MFLPLRWRDGPDLRTDLGNVLAANAALVLLLVAVAVQKVAGAGVKSPGHGPAVTAGHSMWLLSGPSPRAHCCTVLAVACCLRACSARAGRRRPASDTCWHARPGRCSPTPAGSRVIPARDGVL